MTDRMDRVETTLKRKISVILQEEINDPRVRHVTITHVEVTRDLRIARVFYIIIADEKEKQDIARGLKSAASFIRSELADRLSIKFTPKILFKEDSSAEKEESIDRIFERIDEEHHETKDDNGKGTHDG
ncbi:MAG: 30S ribosome-binding factor RbfA [Candidatus Omnitrophota bacterium]